MTDNKATLETGNAAISAGNNEGFLVHCTDDTRWNFVGERVLEGKDAVRQWMAEAYLQPPKFNVENLIAEGDYVTALGTITMNDEQGTPSEYAYCDVWRFRDGKIAELNAYVIKTGKVES